MLGDEMRQSAKILVVDDEPANVLLLRRVLQRAGYTSVSTLTDSRDVLKVYDELQPDLILLDLNMPHKNGFTVLEELRAIVPERTYLPILMLTADANPETKSRALALGARDFLTKPFDFTETLLRINNLIETRLLYLQLQDSNAELARQTRELQRFVASPTVEMIQDGKEIVSGAGAMREFAILFSDMRGFTEIAHRLEPAAVFGMLSRSLEIQTGIVLGYLGHLDKIYGDGFLAYFDGPDRVERAVRCALTIRDAAQKMEHRDDVPVPPVGLGINVGHVLFGMLGTTDRIEHTLVGDAVNVCARLCGHAKPFQIVVTEEVCTAVQGRDGISFRPLGPVNLKGKPDPMLVFEVLPGLEA